MATLSTLAQLMLAQDPGIQPYSDALLKANRIQGGTLTNQSALLELEELRRQQASAATQRQFLQANPDFLLGGGGGSQLGSLQAAPPGAITQGPLPGTAGPTQTIAAPQDLSQYASGPPPQATLATLAPQPRPDPLRQLMQQDPDAGLKMLDMRYKAQERVLGMQEKKMGAFGQILQGATDQASWDEAREQIRQVDPQAAARMSPFFRKEERDRWVMQAQSVKDNLTLQVQDLQAQAAVLKARREGRSVDVDNQLRAMGVQPGQETPAQMREALQAVQEGKIAVSASHGTGQLVQTPQGIVRVNPRTGTVDPVEAPGGGPMYPKPTAEEQRAASYGDRAKAAHDTAVTLEEKGLTPGIWSKVGEALPFGLGNYLVGEDQQRYRQTVNQFAQAILRKESGAAISPTEYTMTERTYFPQPGDSKKVIDQKRQERERVIQSMQEEGKQTGRTGTQGQPTSQAPSGSQSSQAPPGGKVVSLAALHAEADRRGVSREQAERQARQKGYEVR